MRRALLLVPPAFLAALLAGNILLKPASSVAEPNTPPPAKEVARGAQLPIGQVVLYSSGVGYFQREGTVEGDARVDLSFPVADVNDLLKSMVLRDLDGGHVSAVSYDSSAPLAKTLQSFAVNLTQNPSLAQILDQARGEKVEVVLLQAGAGQAGTLSGTVIGVEKQRQAVGKDATVEVAVLNLWCADGLRGVKLAEVSRVRFLNPVLEGEFKKALETLALSHDTQKKAVSIAFAGEGKRRVRVGYVIENPIWKTSYRLVLGKTAEDKPYLQGWAVVENPSDEDWRGVRMALVSGRPISFRMDLYTPLYVPRPLVEPELFASLRPVAYSGNMDTNFNVDRLQDLSVPGEADAKARMPDPATHGRLAGKDKAKASLDLYYREKLGEELGKPMDLGRSVSSAASAAKLGDFFQYVLDRPVSLPRQKAAMLPIVGKDVESTRLSIYNERTQARFPLLGLRFKNTSGLHLMQGPLTVFEGSSYAGDARILDLQPGEERLLSYAVDLGTEVQAVPSSDNGRITQVRVVKGILHSTTKIRETKSYTVKNRNEQERTVLIEHPVRHDFTLADTAKPQETASDVYRFEVKVPVGKAVTQAVTEEKVVGSTVQLSNSGDDQVRFFSNQPVTSAKVKKGLEQALALRAAQARTTREIQEMERQLRTITEDQGRLRANLKEMPATAKAYKRYLEKFDQQETQIEKLQADVKRLQGVEHNQRKEFEDFLNNFSAD